MTSSEVPSSLWSLQSGTQHATYANISFVAVPTVLFNQFGSYAPKETVSIGTNNRIWAIF